MKYELTITIPIKESSIAGVPSTTEVNRFLYKNNVLEVNLENNGLVGVDITYKLNPEVELTNTQINLIKFFTMCFVRGLHKMPLASTIFDTG